MNKHLLFGAAVAAGAGLCLAADLAAPAGPAAVAGGREIVKIAYGEFQPVFAGIEPGTKGSTAFVLDYKLTNVSDSAVKPGVYVELRTEAGKAFTDRYDAATYRAAAKALGRKAEPSSASAIRGGELAPGASVDGLANFGAFDPNSDDFQVRVYGLWDPVFRDKQGRTWSERRVLVLSYGRTGDEYDRQLDPVRLRSAKEEIEGELVRLNESK